MVKNVKKKQKYFSSDLMKRDWISEDKMKIRVCFYLFSQTRRIPRGALYIINRDLIIFID